MRPYCCIVLTALLSWLPPVGAQMYRWVDGAGVTHFSQTPPAGAAAAQRLPVPEAPVLGDGDVVEQESERLRQLQEQTTETRKEQEANREKAAAKAAIDEKNCATARHNYQVLQSATRRLIRTPDGQYHRLTEEQRQQRMQQAEEMMNKSCGDQP